ncbi:MAG: zf-HC2 domain-containing protein [Gemmatimonadales bacterium]|nr:zf-HC2 domain-containing protein [Gemmatimonadales bacterium]
MRDHAMDTDHIDCASAMERLFEFLDGELGPELEVRLRAHLEVCSHCFGQAGFERRFLAAVQAAREAERCPDRLRSRVLEALQREGWTGSDTP